MSAVLATELHDDSVAITRLCLLGTGGVGRAVLNRLQLLQQSGRARQLHLVGVANSRRSLSGASLLPSEVLERIDHVASLSTPDFVDGALPPSRGRVHRIVIDATASDTVAARHAEWLAAGIHVVTANKLGAGSSVARWQSIRAAQSHGQKSHGQVQYGDAATVGAGLPLLRSVRALVDGGDDILSIAGVLSGSLAWLLHRFDGTRPFSELVREARALGYTEPDPRDDLAGADVCRKLLILARAAGIALEARDVRVTPLLDAELARVDRADVDAALVRLDAPLQQHLDHARRNNAQLHFVARWQAGQASVGLEALATDDPLAGGSGSDNRVVIHSTRYGERPLLIQGPGAGNSVTAAALLDEVMKITAN